MYSLDGIRIVGSNVVFVVELFRKMYYSVYCRVFGERTLSIGVGIISRNNKGLVFPNLDKNHIMDLIGLIESNDASEVLNEEDHKRVKVVVVEPMKRRRPQNVETLLRKVLNN